MSKVIIIVGVVVVFLIISSIIVFFVTSSSEEKEEKEEKETEAPHPSVGATWYIYDNIDVYGNDIRHPSESIKGHSYNKNQVSVQDKADECNNNEKCSYFMINTKHENRPNEAYFYPKSTVNFSERVDPNISEWQPEIQQKDQEYNKTYVKSDNIEMINHLQENGFEPDSYLY
jgi:hypothetical protein